MPQTIVPAVALFLQAIFFFVTAEHLTTETEEEWNLQTFEPTIGRFLHAVLRIVIAEHLEVMLKNQKLVLVMYKI